MYEKEGGSEQFTLGIYFFFSCSSGCEWVMFLHFFALKRDLLLFGFLMVFIYII